MSLDNTEEKNEMTKKSSFVIALNNWKGVLLWKESFPSQIGWLELKRKQTRMKCLLCSSISTENDNLKKIAPNAQRQIMPNSLTKCQSLALSAHTFLFYQRNGSFSYAQYNFQRSCSAVGSIYWSSSISREYLFIIHLAVKSFISTFAKWQFKIHNFLLSPAIDF